MRSDLRYRNRRLALISFFGAASMVGASYAAVPLYEIFCQVTGYGGTTQVAEVLPDRVLDRRITIRFNADTDRALPWKFSAVKDKVDVRVGENTLAFYRARNVSGGTVVGTATFNVTPDKAGIYFNKIECFCFQEQLLGAQQKVDMPVSFFIDPEIVNDPNLEGVTTITLSYTFFKSEAKPKG